MKLSSTEEIQKVLLEDYVEVSHIWERHSYFYCLTGGSVLGAIRHKGYIPWDDDFDVGLARKDYEDFIKNTSSELPDHLRLHLRKKTQQYVIIDTRYEISYDQGNADALYEGESIIENPIIDLQIFDGTPNNKLHRMIFCFHALFLRGRIKISTPDKIHQEKWRPKWENLLISIIKKVKKPDTRKTERLMNKFNQLISSHPFEKSLYIADFIGKYHFKDIYPKSWWYPTIDAEFESIKVPIPNGYDKYLTQIYGDYMTIPKKEEQVQHTNSTVQR